MRVTGLGREAGDATAHVQPMQRAGRGDAGRPRPETIVSEALSY
jgi:hypothetical protein